MRFSPGTPSEARARKSWPKQQPRSRNLVEGAPKRVTIERYDGVEGSARVRNRNCPMQGNGQISQASSRCETFSTVSLKIQVCRRVKDGVTHHLLHMYHDLVLRNPAIRLQQLSCRLRQVLGLQSRLVPWNRLVTASYSWNCLVRHRSGSAAICGRHSGQKLVCSLGNFRCCEGKM